jgi:WD40 repeat protein
MSAHPTKITVAKTVRLKSIGLCIARLPQTERLFVGGSDFKVHEVDMSAENPELIEFQGDNHQSYVTGAAIAGSRLVTGCYDGRLIWWDPQQRQSLRTIPAHDRWIRRITASSDGKRIASVADDMVCKIWDAETGDLIHTLVEHKPLTPHHFPSMLYAVAFSADGQFLATGDRVGHVAVWEVATGRKLEELEAPVMYTWDPKQRRHSIGGIRSLAFSRDGQHLAVGGIGTIGNIDHLDGPSRVEIFDWKTRQRVQEISDTAYKGLVEQIVFPASANWFVFAGGDNGGFVSFYDPSTGKLVHQAKMPMHVHSFVLNESEDTLYAAGHDQVAMVTFKEVPPAEAATTQPSVP